MDELDKRIAKAYELLEYYKQLEAESDNNISKVEIKSMCSDLKTLIKKMVDLEFSEK